MNPVGFVLSFLAYHVAETVQRFGGCVAKYIGDGVLGDQGR
jgi:hypothetical protein